MAQSRIGAEPGLLPLAVRNLVYEVRGTRLIDGQVTATAEKVGDDTILGQMIVIMSRSP